MPYKSSVDVISVWIITAIGNIFAQYLAWGEYLHVIRDGLGVISILLAICYTLWKWRKDKKK